MDNVGLRFFYLQAQHIARAEKRRDRIGLYAHCFLSVFFVYRGRSSEVKPSAALPRWLP